MEEYSVSYLILAFLVGLVIGGIVFYRKGKIDAYQEISDKNMEDIRRRDNRETDYRLPR
jgi:hypothetical protein